MIYCMIPFEPIAEYHKVVFTNPPDALVASSSLMDFVGSAQPDTLLRLVGPERIVMWDDDSMMPRSLTLFLSAGALRILRTLIPLPATEIVLPPDLPAGRALLIGDNRDWERTGGGRLPTRVN